MIYSIPIITLLLPIAYALLNKQRGHTTENRLAELSKPYFYVAMTLCIGVSILCLMPYTLGTSTFALLLLFDFATTWLCFSFGWGKYFPHGESINKATGAPIWSEKEFPPADWVANALVGKWQGLQPYGFVQNWQTVSMAARWFLTFGLLKYLPLAVYFESITLGIAGCALTAIAGASYRLAFTPHTNESSAHAEYLSGAIFGVAQLVLILVIYFGV